MTLPIERKKKKKTEKRRRIKNCDKNLMCKKKID